MLRYFFHILPCCGQLVLVCLLLIFLFFWQVGRDATVHIWDGDNCEVISILKGQHERGVCTVDFSGKQPCAVSVNFSSLHP